MINKRLKIILFSILLFSVGTIFCQNAGQSKKMAPASQTDTVTIKSKDFYLELRATIRQLKNHEADKTSEIKLLDSVLITLFSGDVPYSEIWTNKKGKCSFKLPLDKNFKIQISKPGFVTKYITVSTKIPAEKRDVFSFSFDVDLFEQIKGLDVSVLNNPIAKVAYNIILEGFAYDVNYTSRINADLKKMYNNYYRLQKLANDTAAFKKDSLLFKNDSQAVPKVK